ncbi:TPA: GGDEF-domain containing protein, partial [Enterobacter hormaechei subsp. xiangfangensis]|nr:GGDEF-domain containing protein [Enterobacter hormaechei]HDS2348694.1 GGDEF-domain containing protein [Enterobacter hormaechei subsp. xiangfangensis]
MNRILVGIIFSLFITTGYIAFLVYDRQQELQKLTHYTESWSVAQLVSEYYRFESWIGLYATETDDVTVDQVRMRLEIMLSQNDLLKEGGLGRYINSEKAHQALALRLENILNYLDGHLEKMSRSELKLYLNNMHSLDAPLSQLSSTALTKDVNTINETNLKIQVLYYIYSALSLLLVILSFILGFLIIYQNKNILKAHM